MLQSTDDNWAGDTEYDRINRETVKDFLSARNALVAQMEKEQHKGMNRLICIIREHGRKWDKDHANDETFNQGGFIKVIKSELEKLDFPSEFKNALKYL